MQSGANVVLSPDGSLKTTDMSYKVTPVTEGHSVEIEAPDRKRAGQLIKRAAKQFPQLNAEDAANAARVVTLPDDDAMRVSVNFGSQAVGGGAWTIVWLFYLLRIRRKLMPWVELHAVIKREQEHGTCFRFLADTPAGIIGPDPDMGHVLVLRLLPATGRTRRIHPDTGRAEARRCHWNSEGQRAGLPANLCVRRAWRPGGH